MTTLNKNIIEQFTKLVQQIKSEYLNSQIDNNVKETTSNNFRLKQTKNILNILKRIDFEITSSSQLSGIPGIGPGTKKRIDEILTVGYLSELSEKYTKTEQKKINSLQELEEVIGIGPSLAKKLIIEYKIKSIDELKKAIKNGTYDANDKIKLGLKYYGIIKGDIPRSETEIVNKYLEKEAHKIDPELEIMLCGSYRRGRETSGDFDVLIFHPDFKYSKHVDNPEKYNLQPLLIKYVEHLKKINFILDHITDKNYYRKYMGFCQYKKYPVRRLDIRFIPYNSRYSAMLYFTGPYELNTIMRSMAKKESMTLNEYGLYKIDPEDHTIKKQIKISSEEDIFKKLDMKYLTPEQREKYNTGKIKKTKNMG